MGAQVRSLHMNLGTWVRSGGDVFTGVREKRSWQGYRVSHFLINRKFIIVIFPNSRHARYSK